MRALLPLLLLLGCPEPGKDLTDIDADGLVGDEDCDDEDADVGGPTPWLVDADHDGYASTTPVQACVAPDDATDVGGDCDDTQDQVHPGRAEACNGVDDDCDGVLDDGATTLFYADTDGDGFGDAAVFVEGCEAPEGYVTNGEDCDDADPYRFPGNTELCNDADDDCDAEVDEGAVGIGSWYLDADGDGHGDPADVIESCFEQPGRSTLADDCDDSRAAVNPAATELCNGLDDDCDGSVDEADAADTASWYLDGDGDGWGTLDGVVAACAQPAGYAPYDGDCDDADARFHPGAAEADCTDANDYNCDGSVAYADVDGDGWAACTECDDGDAAVNPAATEVCNAVDDDCDGTVDEADAVDAGTWYADADTDGYGGPAVSTVACDAPAAFVADATDCDDGAPAVNPGAVELCNGIDDDCDASVDEDSAADAGTWYQDDDGDGYGDPAVSRVACDAPTDFVADATDCDDGRRLTHPGATEYCNTTDDDCDGAVDDGAVDALTWWADDDADTYGDASDSTSACSAPVGYVRDDDDCDDTDASINPAGTELCNGEDDDCDGSVDDGLAFSTWYTDADGDGFGDGSGTYDCAAPAGGTTTDGDCDDGDADINPDADEVCDGADNDCDGTVDGVATTYDFASGISSSWMALNGDATWVSSSGGYLQLVGLTGYGAGSAWFVERMDASEFEVSFSFQIHGGSGADGISFAWLSDTSTSSLGATGGYLGLYGLHGYAVEFDTWYNAGMDPGENHIALVDPATFTNYTYSTAIPELEDNGWHDATISMSGGTVEVWVDGTRYINYPISGYAMTDAMMGFTAATGGSTNYHDIDDVSFACP